MWMGWTRLRQANWFLDTWSPFLAFHGTLPSPQTSKYLHSPLDPRKICPFLLGSPVARGSKFPGPAPLSTLITVLEFPLAWDCVIAVGSAGLLSNAHPPGPGDWPVWALATDFLAFWFSLGSANGRVTFGNYFPSSFPVGFPWVTSVSLPKTSATVSYCPQVLPRHPCAWMFSELLFPTPLFPSRSGNRS